jgi:hypothetical protein
MAETPLTNILTLDNPLSLSPAADSLNLTFVATDDVNGNSVPCTGRELLIFKNTDVGDHTVQINAADDDYGREGDTGPYTISAGEECCPGALPIKLYKDNNGDITFITSDALVQVAVIRFPATA